MEKSNEKLATNILGALECAKEALALLPQLPLNLKPVYFRILDAIYKIDNNNGCLRVTDISKASGFLLPNTTKFINEMVELNILKKVTSASDKRVVYVQTTDLGKQYIQEYVRPFVEGLEDEFAKIDEANCLIMIKTLHEVYQAMKTVYK